MEAMFQKRQAVIAAGAPRLFTGAVDLLFLGWLGWLHLLPKHHAASGAVAALE